VLLGDLDDCPIYHKMNMGNWWWDTQDQLPARVTIVPVRCASDKTHLTMFPGDQHASPLYPSTGDIRKDIRCTPNTHTSILVQLVPYAPKSCQKHWQVMAFLRWNCAIPTRTSWHYWSQVEMEYCWWIPEIMLSSFGCLGRGLSRTSYACSSQI